MSYLELVAGRARQERQLVDVLLELTYACNLDCFFCYNDRALQGRPLALSHYERLLEDLAQLGVWTLTLSGGEPLAHADFFAIGARARALGFVVRIKTNGHALHRAMAERIRAEIDPYALEISLHGATPATHDRQTQVPGSFERLMANLEVLRALDQRVRLRATLTAWNGHEAEAMLALADRLGLPLDAQAEVTPRDNGDQEPLAIRPSLGDRARLAAILWERSRQERQARTPSPKRVEGPPIPDADQPNCGAGVSSLVVDPVGNVYPCVQWRRHLGNLHQQPIREIWAGSEALEGVRADNIAAAGVLDAMGIPKGSAHFCPGSAARELGRPDAVYEEVRAQVEVAGPWLGRTEPAHSATLVHQAG